MVGVELGAPDPVRVARQDLDRTREVAAVPELHFAVVAGSDQHERLVGVIVHTPNTI